MKDLKNILLVYPCDGKTLELAAKLLQTHHAKLTVIQVAPVIEESKVVGGDGKKLDLQNLLVREYESELEEFVRPLQAKGRRIYQKVLVGQPFLEIIRQVISNKHDLVMMTADGKGGLREQLFGTLSQHLMRKCPCPVWVVKPTRRKKLRNILAAVDPDPNNETRDSLNSQILQFACSIANLDGAALHVVHAWTTFGGEVTRSRRWMTAGEIRLYVEKVASEHRLRLDQLLKSHPEAKPRVHMVQGKPGNVIPEIANSEAIDLLVMGTVCRTGIPGFFIGNTAEMILNELDCSVLTLKPHGFETPVKLS